jgi:hypothetical protein
MSPSPQAVKSKIFASTHWVQTLSIAAQFYIHYTGFLYPLCVVQFNVNKTLVDPLSSHPCNFNYASIIT